MVRVSCAALVGAVLLAFSLGYLLDASKGKLRATPHAPDANPPGARVLQPVTVQAAAPTWLVAMGILTRERPAADALRDRLRWLYASEQRLVTPRFVVDESYATRNGGATDLFGVPHNSTTPHALTYKALWWWRLAPNRIAARFYLKTDDDAVLHLPTLLLVVGALELTQEEPQLHYAGDINWSTMNLEALIGHCWSMVPLASLSWKQKKCAKEYGPVPFATGSLVLVSAPVAVRLSETLERLAWLQRSDLNGYYEDRLVGLAISHDERPIRLTYLNTHDHYDAPSGIPFMRAPSGQPAIIYEHEGPGGLLISHHVRSVAGFAAAVDAQGVARQSARHFRLECTPFASTAPGVSRSMPGAAGAEASLSFPRPIRGWHACALKFEYALAEGNMGHCGATADEGNCEKGSNGGYNTTIHGLHTLDECRARCRRCARCNYVSFSLLHEDCSWYNRCDLRSLSLRWAGFSYRSGVVRSWHKDHQIY